MAMMDEWTRSHISWQRWRFWLTIPKGWEWTPAECRPGEYKFKYWHSKVGFWVLELTVGWRFPMPSHHDHITGIVFTICNMEDVSSVKHFDRTIILGILHSEEELKQWLAKKPKDDKGYMKAWGIK